ncbi:MAG: phosphodiester glycosidase family protein [Kouleothrix sp.]
MIYAGTYPKTAVGVGTHEDGTTFLVFATSYGTTGVELAGQLKAMGCSDALGGDDDTSTQAVWRGAQVQPGTVRKVPDALAVYIRP